MKAFSFIVIGSILSLLLSANAQSPDFLRTGFPLPALYNVDHSDAKVAMGHLLKEIVERHDVGYSTEIIEEEETFLKNLTAGQYDFFLIFGYDYLRLRKSYPMRPILVGQYANDSVLEEFVLLTQNKQDLTGLSESPLLVSRGTGELPTLWLDKWLLSQNLPLSNETFGPVEYNDNISRTVLPVFFGKAKACLITRSGFDLMTELNPQIAKRLKVHAQSPPLLRSVLCLSPQYVEKEKGLIKREGLLLNEHPEGEQLITLLRMKKVVPFDPDYLTNLEKLMTHSAESTAVASTLAEDNKDE